ncbi:MAG: acyltransferase [Cyclobacteriaceae bacterium]
MSRKEFFPEIETLRAIAVIMVMLAHFIPKSSPFHIPYMFYGVDLFFAISGFLITYILLGQVHGEKNKNPVEILKNFFVRRVLRLFPVYYAFIGFFFILRNVFSIYIWTNEYNWYFFTYLQNMYFFKEGALNTSFSHLWSLGVEEQFYLVWPFLIMLVPLRYLVNVFMLLIAVSIALNVIYQPQVDAFRVLTIANMHTLGGGAFLAYLFRYRREGRLYLFLQQNRMGLFLISLSLLVFALNYPVSPHGFRIWMIEFWLMCTVVMSVLISLDGWPNPFSILFHSRWIQHIGKVSYGIYLFHMLIPVALSVIISKLPVLGFVLPDQPWLRVPLLMIYSYLLAIASFYFFEAYFLKLKAKFN